MLFIKKIGLVLIAIMLFFISCKKDPALSPVRKKTITPEYFDTLKTDRKYLLTDISYGLNLPNKLDICLPKNRSLTGTPIIVFIHGGGWLQGDKIDFYNDIQQYSDSGFACVSVNYRYADTTLNISYNDLIKDINDALSFIINNSYAFQISSNRIGMAGFSAGAHLALMASNTSPFITSIKACASVSGPIDLLDSTQRTNISWFNVEIKNLVGTGLISYNDTALYKMASPYWNVNVNSKPTLLMQGMDDNIISSNQSVKLQAKLNSLFVYNSIVLFPGRDHYIWNDSRDIVFNWFKARL